MSKSLFTSMILIVITVSTVFWSAATVAIAQDNCPRLMDKIRVDETISGRISTNIPIVKYCFEGRSGEEVVINLVRDSGSLDPFLELTNLASDEIFITNDDRSLSTSDAQIIFTLPDTSPYVINATRFDKEEGKTQGTYKLTMTSNLEPLLEPSTNQDDSERPDECPLVYDFIRYGDSLEGVIDDDTSSFFFCFVGEKGDEVVIDAIGDETDLDTILILMALPSEDVLEENDDIRLGNRNSRIVYELPASGAYLIRVARYNLENGTSEGNFTLSLDTLSTGDFTNIQDPPPYDCYRPLIQELNATQWLEANTDYNFRLNFGCEGLVSVSILGKLFTTAYSIVDDNLQLTLDDETYTVQLESDGTLVLRGDEGELFVFDDVGTCSDEIEQDLIEGVWFVEENTTFFRLDFMCGGVVLLTIDSITEAYTYDFNTSTAVLTIGMSEPLIWTDVVISPGSFLSVEAEADAFVFTNILIEIEDIDEADI